MLAVGSPYYDLTTTDQGAVYVFNLNTASLATAPTFVQRLTHNVNNISLAASDYFGMSVALNGAGTLLAVGAERDDTFTTDAGAVYLFNISNPTLQTPIKRKTTTADFLTWSLKNSDYFGGAVALNSTGSIMAVGAYGDDGNGTDRGAVYLFNVDTSNLSSTPTFRYKLADGVAGLSLTNSDLFGFSLALNNVGNILAVGAYQDDVGGTGRGAVYLYNLNAADLTQAPVYRQKIDDAHPGFALANSDQFGRSVALNATGDILAVGALTDATGGAERGAVYLFNLDTSNLATQATYRYKIAHGLPVALSLTNSDRFGQSVALNGLGDILAVGAYLDDTGGTDRGAAYIFSLNPASLASAPTYRQKIANGTVTGASTLTLANTDLFGYSIALDDAGSTLVVGAQRDDTGGTDRGAAYVYTLNTASLATAPSLRVKLGQGDTSVVSNTVTLGNSDYFATSLALTADGTLLAVGTERDDTGSTDRGAVYFYNLAPVSSGLISYVSTSSIQASLNAGTDVTLQTSSSGGTLGNIFVRDAITKSAGSAATLTLNAHNNITVTNNIISTSGALNLNLLSDSDGLSGGAISVNGATITTNGGNFTASGGTDPFNTITPNDDTDSRATGNSALTAGVSFSGGSLTTGAGNVYIRGKGYDNTNAGLKYGVVLGTPIQTTTGNIDLQGIGGDGLNFNVGLYVGSQISSSSGTITAVGRGGAGTANNEGLRVDNGGAFINVDGVINAYGYGGNSTGHANYGVMIQGTGTIYTTGNGAVNVFGYGGNGTGSSHGIILNNTTLGIHTQNAILTLNGTGGTGETTGANLGVYVAGSKAYTENGNLIINAIGGTGAAGTNAGMSIASQGKVYTNNGELTVNATGGQGGSNNSGLYIQYSSAYVSALGTGNTNVNAIAGSGDSSGVYLYNGYISSNTGNTTIMATSSGTGSGILTGFYFGIIESTGGGEVTINLPNNGFSAAGLATPNSYLTQVSSTTGNIILNGGYNTSQLVNVLTTGQVSLAPYNISDTIGVNGGSGTYLVDLSQYQFSTPSSLTIGSPTSTSTTTIADGWDLSSYAFPIQVYGGNIVTGGINAGSNALTLTANTGNITLSSGTLVSSNANGDAIILNAENGNFINLSGLATAIDTPNGRYIIYSSNPLNDNYGAMTLPTRRYGTPQAGDAGNYIYYNYVPTLTIRAKNQTITYGDGILDGESGYEIDLSTLVNGDTVSSVLSGSGIIATNYTNAGNYLGGITLSQGTLTSLIGYAINLVAGDLTINKAALTISVNDATRRIGANNPVFAYTAQGLRLGHVLSDVMSNFQVSSTAKATSAPGAYRITAQGTLINPNYTLTSSEGILNITPQFSLSNNEQVIQVKTAVGTQGVAGTSRLQPNAGIPFALTPITVRCGEEGDSQVISCKTFPNPLLQN